MSPNDVNANDMQANDDVPDPALERRLAALRREIAPQQDLWLRIRPALPLARRPVDALPAQRTLPWRRRLMPAAALAATVVLAVLLLPRAFERTPSPSVGPPGALGIPADAAVFVKARTTLEQQFTAVLAQLAPATRAQIEKDLQIVRKAEADVAAALVADPANPLLIEFWQRTREHEIDLMTDVLSSSRLVAIRSQT
jgi:hypothetical protein